MISVFISKLKKTQRLDPEFYSPQSVVIKKTKKLSDIADITLGTTPGKINTGSTPFYKVENIEKWTTPTAKKHISISSLPAKFIAKKGDILLTIKGRIGDATLIEEKGFFNQDIARINSQKVSPQLLLALLNSEFVQNQIKKVSTNQMHPYIRISDLRKIHIPQLDALDIEKINKKVKDLARLNRQIHQSKIKINQFFQKKITNKVYKISFNRISKYDRLDAEFLLTETTQNKIKINELKNLDVRIGKYIYKFTKKGTPYIRAKDIKNGKIKKINTFVLNGKKSQTCPQEILLTRVGDVKAICVKNEKVIPSDNFLRMKFNDTQITPQILACFFNSPLGRQELNRHMQGSKQIRLNKKNLLNVSIPKLSSDIKINIEKELNNLSKYEEKKEKIISELLDPF